MTPRMLLVVSDAADLPEVAPDHLVLADQYLEGGPDLSQKDAVVVNLCRSYLYRTKGYYVSLLADARAQRATPTVETIEGLSDPFGLFRALQEGGVPTVEPDSHAAAEEETELLACFGTPPEERFRPLCLAVYRAWPAPLLRLRLARIGGEWRVASVSAVSLDQLDAAERAPLVAALLDEGAAMRKDHDPPRETRAAIAVLVDEADPFSPSNPEAIDRLERVAARRNVHVRRIGMGDVARLGEYDALFIRALTGVREPTFPFALRAEALGMPVIDDTQSIIRCSNKVFLEELLRREGLPTPRTLVLSAHTPWAQLEELGLPFVIKLPDSSFSAAVHKIASREEFEQRCSEMFRRSPLLIAQEFLPTAFDWRITVLDGRLLFAARYYMARGHWQIRSDEAEGDGFGKVEAVPRDQAPREVVELGVRAASLIGDGLYGVDLKDTGRGPVIIEINDNPNLDAGYDDAADGDLIYDDLVAFFLRRVEESAGRGEHRPPRERERPRHYRPFEVAGVELEYAVVDEALEPVSKVEEAFRVIAGRPTSDVELGAVAFSNEIADHVFEIKLGEPTRSLAEAEEHLAAGVSRFSATLRERFGARLLPTGMHPWMDPREARLWSRSNSRIYQAYAKLFDVKTHGWMNVHATHLNLPLGREQEGVAMLNAAALLIPYLPALAASTPVYDGRLQEAEDGRLAWILQHQARIPESCGEIVPETVESFTEYRRAILRPMYRALDHLEGAEILRREFFNARGAVLRFSRRAMEVRVLDTQECVKMDVAVVAFVKAALKHLSRRVLAGRIRIPEHGVLVEDFREAVLRGSRARVLAPHLGDAVTRGADGKAAVEEVLRLFLEGARRGARKEELPYLEIAERMIGAGTLAEGIRGRLLPHQGDEAVFRATLREVYGELADCLERNEPWAGRGI